MGGFVLAERPKESEMESYVRKSLLAARDGEELFTSDGAAVAASLDGYAVVPLEVLADQSRAAVLSQQAREMLATP